MHELQQILLQKLPRLGELKPWCKVIHEDWRECTLSSELIIFEADEHWPAYKFYDCYPIWVIYDDQIETIIGHPFTHADILEALGEDWAMDWAYYLLQNDWAGSFEAVVLETEEWERNIILPKNLSDLSLPEYEETRKQLIQLLTK